MAQSLADGFVRYGCFFSELGVERFCDDIVLELVARYGEDFYGFPKTFLEESYFPMCSAH